MATIPKNVIAEDHRLEASAEKSQENLAKHRWHQTLDPKGPGYSLREYAKAVGRGYTTIHSFAKGYDDWQADRTGTISLSDCMVRVGITGDKLEATEAVAQARGIAPRTVRSHHRPVVEQTMKDARDRVEKVPGTTMSEAIKTVAKENEVVRRAVAQRKLSEPIVFVKITKDLIDAKRCLKAALTDAQGHQLNDEWTDLLVAAIDQTQALLDLVRMAVAGTAEIDWDAELAKLGSL